MKHIENDSVSLIDGSYRRAAQKTARMTIYLVFATVAVAVIWAAFAQIDQITRGDGRVIPLRRMQTIQSLDGGTLAELKVHEGDVVSKDQVIAILDPTRSRAAYLAAQSEIETLTAQVARLEAEVLEQPTLDFGPEPTHTQQTEQRLFAARRKRLEASLSSLEDERASLKEQLDITAPLAAGGSVSKVDLLQLRQKMAEIDGKIADARNGYVQDAYRDLSERRAKLSTLQEQSVQKEDQLRHTVVRSPVEGRVNDIPVTTIGGVIQPGETIMEITPIDDQLLIETKILPRDVAFIAPGMPASVKITAYDFAVYGDLRGTVTQISEDTVQEDSSTGPQKYYRVMVQTDRSYLERSGEKLPIRPGMVAQVDIESGKQSVLSYLIRPLLRARLR